MRLPWRRTRLPEHAVEEAVAARAAAGEHLAQVREREPEVRRVAQQLRELRQSNHFRERLRVQLGLEPEGHGHAPHA